MPRLLVPGPEDGWHSAQELPTALVMIRDNETTLSPGFLAVCLLHSQPGPPREHCSQFSMPVIVCTHMYTHHTQADRHTHACTPTHIYTNTQAHTHTHT